MSAKRTASGTIQMYYKIDRFTVVAAAGNSEMVLA